MDLTSTEKENQLGLQLQKFEVLEKKPQNRVGRRTLVDAYVPQAVAGVSK